MRRSGSAAVTLAHDSAGNGDPCARVACMTGRAEPAIARFGGSPRVVPGFLMRDVQGTERCCVLSPRVPAREVSVARFPPFSVRMQRADRRNGSDPTGPEAEDQDRSRRAHPVRRRPTTSTPRAVCQRNQSKGKGPAAPAMKAKVPDLTTFAARHGGKFNAVQVNRSGGRGIGRGRGVDLLLASRRCYFPAAGRGPICTRRNSTSAPSA